MLLDVSINLAPSEINKEEQAIWRIGGVFVHNPDTADSMRAR
jgi:hypothetical protein